MEKTKIDKIPSIFKNVTLSDSVRTSEIIPAEEGTFVVVEVLESDGKKNDLDLTDGRMARVVTGDVIAGVLGYRKASVEFSGYVPLSVNKGDNLYLLCESGIIGDISGVYASWGSPLPVGLLGAIVYKSGKVGNLKQFALAMPDVVLKDTPVIAFVGTRMDCGKTTMACKVVHALTLQRKHVAALKATGVAFTQDLYKLKDYGADPVVDFVDTGYPSTCNGDASGVVASCLHLLNHVKTFSPDFIVMEFGDSIIGEYHVLDVLKNSSIKSQISFLVLAAHDFVGVYGAKEILGKAGLSIDLVTGPIVNSQIGVTLVEKYFGLDAESNQKAIPKTIALIQNKLSGFDILQTLNICL